MCLCAMFRRHEHFTGSCRHHLGAIAIVRQLSAMLLTIASNAEGSCPQCCGHLPYNERDTNCY